MLGNEVFPSAVEEYDIWVVKVALTPSMTFCTCCSSLDALRG